MHQLRHQGTRQRVHHVVEDREVVNEEELNEVELVDDDHDEVDDKTE
jgi:hypothetical protein